LAGVKDFNTIDLVTHDPATDELVVIMIEDRAWAADPGQLDQLLKKINTYLHFVEDGDLVQHFPQAAGKPVRLQLDCNEPPTGAVQQFIKEAQQVLLSRGITFAVNVIVTPRG